MGGNFFLNILLPSLECKNIRAIDYKFFGVIWGNNCATWPKKVKNPYFSKMIREYSSVVHYLTCWKGLKKSQKNHFYRLNCVENAFNVFNRPENMISSYFITLDKIFSSHASRKTKMTNFLGSKSGSSGSKYGKFESCFSLKFKAIYRKIYEWYKKMKSTFGGADSMLYPAQKELHS